MASKIKTASFSSDIVLLRGESFSSCFSKPVGSLQSLLPITSWFHLVFEDEDTMVSKGWYSALLDHAQQKNWTSSSFSASSEFTVQGIASTLWQVRFQSNPIYTKV